MKSLRHTAALFISLFSLSLYGQSTEQSNEKLRFEGKPIVTLFESYQQGLGEQSDVSTYEHQRGYFGYAAKSNKGWGAQVIFDVSSKYLNEKSQLLFEASLKNAELTWSGKGFKVAGGIIKTQNYALKESAWGHRYIMASYENIYNFAPSADFGVRAAYDINDMLSADVSITNGKGHKIYEFTNNCRYGVGVTAKVTDNITLRGFYDHYSDDGSGRDQINSSLFVGYKMDKFRIGAEYNYLVNYGFVDGVDMHGGSIHSTYDIIKTLNVFARYDRFTTTDSSSTKPNNVFTVGVDYSPLKWLSVSPNLLVSQDGSDSYGSYLNLNLQIKL